MRGASKARYDLAARAVGHYASLVFVCTRFMKDKASQQTLATHTCQKKSKRIPARRLPLPVTVNIKADVQVV